MSDSASPSAPESGPAAPSLPDWMQAEIPEVPAPDDAALEQALDVQFDIAALYRALYSS
jgi:hypothetical protein